MNVILRHPNPTDGGGSARPQPTIARLSLDSIEADAQVRTDFDTPARREAHASLTSSLKDQGQIVPILVYFDHARGKHVILDGERRFRAAKDAELLTLEAVVFHGKPSPGEVAIVQITIDQQRENLNPIEKAAAYDRVMKANGWSANELAARINVAHTTITRAVDMLTLSDEFQEMIRKGDLSPYIARELARLPDELRLAAWKQIQDEGLNGAGAQKLVTKLLKPKKKTGRPKAKDNTYTAPGFKAVITNKGKFTVTPTKAGKAPTKQEMLAALEVIVQKFREEITQATASERSGTVHILAAPPATETHAAL